MAQQDITSSAFTANGTTGEVAIANVTGDVVITVDIAQPSPNT